MEALTMLKQQHQEVDELFDRIQMADESEKVTLMGQISEKLTLHMMIEERHFYPFCMRMGIQDMVDQSIKEHAEIKQLISELLQMKRNDPMIEQSMRKLMMSVRSHMNEEESTLFPRLMSIASEESLRGVGMEMERTMDEMSQQELLKLAEHEGSTVMP